MGTESLLKSLNDHDVRYVIIGASAFPVHGYVRATLDLDILIEPTEENANNVLKALSAFGYDMKDVSVLDLLTKKVLIRQYEVETDIHPSVKGVAFEDVWNTRIQSLYGRTTAFFADLDSLIRMKRAANRPQDREDLTWKIHTHEMMMCQQPIIMRVMIQHKALVNPAQAGRKIVLPVNLISCVK